MQTARQVLGERGERIAEQWLQARGWKILDRRFRSGHRDIDLVMEHSGADGRVVAFVEVKTRVSAAFGGPLGAVHWRKQRELVRSASVWIDRHGRPNETYRFDVIGVLVEGNSVRIKHIENAFTPASRA